MRALRLSLILRVARLVLGRSRSILRRWHRRLSPPIPERYLPSLSRLEVDGAAQRSYSDEYRRHLESLQSDADVGEAPTSLSYFPVAKNIRWVATALCHNIERGRRTVVAAGNRREEEYLASQSRPAWKPWLWSRISRAQLGNVGRDIDEKDLAWPTYFRSLSGASVSHIPTNPPAPPPGGNTERILRMAACVNHTFQLNDHMEALIANHRMGIGWEEEPTIGIHIRRGDAATETLEEQTRPSYSLDDYLVVADLMSERYGYRTIYLSTESESEIERAHELRPQYRILSQQHDRDFFPRIGDTSVFIEDLAFSDPSVIEPIVNSAIVDLWFLQHCSAFIGTFNSEFSMLGWLLCLGQNGSLVPYVNLSETSVLEDYQGNLEFVLMPKEL